MRIGSPILNREIPYRVLMSIIETDLVEGSEKKRTDVITDEYDSLRQVYERGVFW